VCGSRGKGRSDYGIVVDNQTLFTSHRIGRKTEREHFEVFFPFKCLPHRRKLRGYSHVVKKRQLFRSRVTEHLFCDNPQIPGARFLKSRVQEADLQEALVFGGSRRSAGCCRIHIAVSVIERKLRVSFCKLQIACPSGFGLEMGAGICVQYSPGSLARMDRVAELRIVDDEPAGSRFESARPFMNGLSPRADIVPAWP